MNSIENIDKLQEEVNNGPVIKRTYKELCDWIGWRPNSNHNIQLKSLSKWMKVVKTDEGYVVLEIYDEATRQSKTPKQGRPRKEVDPHDYIVKRPVGRPRKKNCLTMDELEERQGYSLRFRADVKYPLLAYNIIMHDVLLNDGYKYYAHDELMIRLGIYNPGVFQTEEYLNVLKDYHDLFSVEYYIKSCCETILQLNILKNICDDKHIFIRSNAYYTYSYDDSGTHIIFSSDEKSELADTIVKDSLDEWEIDNYYKLYYSKNIKEKRKIDAVRGLIRIRIQNEIGWDHWGRGYKFTINPDIPLLAVRHLDQYDVEAGREYMNKLTKERIEHLLYKKSQLFVGYDPDKPETKMAFGEDLKLDKVAYEDRCQRIDKLIDRFITI